MDYMSASSEQRGTDAPTGTKRRSPSPIRQRPHKASKNHHEGRLPAGTKGHNKQDMAQKERVRLNQIQDDEKSRQWVAQEDDFVLGQAKRRAEIRIKEGRAKPIDCLALALRRIDTTRNTLDDEYDDSEMEVMDPSRVLEESSERQLSELQQGIDSFISLEKNAYNKDYWRTLGIICADLRRKQDADDPEGRAVSSVSSDIDHLLSPKSLQELEGLEVQISRKLNSNEPIDTDYWEQLLKSLLVWKAKAKMRNVYERILESYPAVDGDEQVTQAGPKLQDLVGQPKRSSHRSAKSGQSKLKRQLRGQPLSEAATRSIIMASEAPSGRFAAIPTEDFSQATKALYEKEVSRGISENEEIFGGEEDVDTKSKALWSGKYRPRKPRYFNRVQMGYEWNKYNQTHYDHDNPPPKVVHGYKFNIFYPDLIDKTKAPTYKIEREGGRKKGQSFTPAGEDDTCLIRFMSGPPYEDVAFRIVDKEWDYSAKRERGFRSSFDKGILQLHFQFKKVFYRK